jgi:hypothetical protein
MNEPDLSLLILDAKDDVEFLDTTPGWNAEDDWVPFTVPAGMYKAQRALNPFNPDGMWIFVQGTRIGQREDWLINAETNGIKVSLLEARPAVAESVVNSLECPA